MKWPRLTRRTALRAALVAAILLPAEILRRRTEERGLGNWLRWTFEGRRNELLGAPVPVSIVRVPTYGPEVAPALAEALRPLALPDLRGKRVVLKPNLVDHIPDLPTTTHPTVLDAAIGYFQDAGAGEIIVAEASAFRRDGRQLLHEAGYDPVLAARGVPFVDLNYDDPVKVPVKGSYARLDSLFLPRTVLEADFFVTLPKMKTHHWSGLTLAMKSLYGVVPGMRYGWPKNTLHVRGIPAMIVELATTIPASLAIVDGIVGMDGDGPLYGNPRPTGVLVAGRDLVAVDATCARIMGFDPAKVDYLAFAGWAGVGMVAEDKIRLHGAPLAQVRQRYEPAPIVL
jgi:uncharacterized protein (DUF362 family)